MVMLLSEFHKCHLLIFLRQTVDVDFNAGVVLVAEHSCSVVPRHDADVVVSQNSDVHKNVVHGLVEIVLVDLRLGVVLVDLGVVAVADDHGEVDGFSRPSLCPKLPTGHLGPFVIRLALPNPLFRRFPAKIRRCNRQDLFLPQSGP